MSTPRDDVLRGASADRVRAALRARDPLPGGRGFAGLLADPPDRPGPVLVRDVLGREPLFVEADTLDATRGPAPAAPTAWGFDPTALDDPAPVPAGGVVSAGGGASASGVDDVWRLPDLAATVDRGAAQRAVDDAVNAALADLAGDADRPGDSGLAVAFSGGVDSGLVAAAAPAAPRYVAGFEGCHDVAAARDAVATADHGEPAPDLRVVEITHDDIRRAAREVAAATGRRNPMDVAIAVPLYLAGEAAAADGYDRIALGQGADELFGGYSKVAAPDGDDRVTADTVRAARTETIHTLPRQLERDVPALRAAGVEPVTPLLNDRVVAAALALPSDLLVDGETRKVALRRAAAGRVPESVRIADKKAVQYGTYVSRELDRLARRAGYKRRMDDHVASYLDALCADEKTAREGRD